LPVESVRRLLALLALLVATPALACNLEHAPSSRWRTVQESGVSWLIDPCGERVYSLGINVLDSVVPRQEVAGRIRYDFRRHYPDQDAWLEATRARVRDWGFNTAGAWSQPPFVLQLPEIPEIDLGRYAKFHWFDPFDPATETKMREEAAKLVAPFKGDARRIGYFTDNEVGWWGGALFVYYSTKPAASFTKQRWVETLQEQYRGDWDRFAADFLPPPGVTDWPDLLRAEAATKLRPGGDGIRAVRRWTGIIAEHYYAMVERVLHEADPDALLFGDRLPIYYDPVALRAMARHMDVLATNYNVDSPDGWVAPYYFAGIRELSGGKPVLISEWFFAARENRSGNRNNGHLMTVGTQTERARGAASATLNFAAVPEVVGTHWFQWPDHPRGGRGDGEDYNFGLVDLEDRPYGELVAALGRANRAAPDRHHAATPATPVEQEVPRARIALDDSSLADWPKPTSLLPPLRPEPGEVAFGEGYLAWDEAGLALATIGQDYYDIDLLAYEGPFPLSEAYRVELGIDAGAGPRRFTLFFIPPRAKTRDHPLMEPLLCDGRPATIADCIRPVGARASYFGADQPRITAETMLPWQVLGVAAPPASVRVELAVTAWHRSRWMSLTGAPPEEALRDARLWPAFRLAGRQKKGPHPGGE
jgi:hypothetical protein